MVNSKEHPAMPPEPIEFMAPVGCRNEVFVTVRLGKEWRTKVQSGVRELLMQDIEGSVIGKAEILDVWFGPLGAIPAIFVENCHDPICRTYSGLQAVLQGCYDQPVDHKTEVTAMRLRYAGEGGVKLATATEMPPESFGGRG